MKRIEDMTALIRRRRSVRAFSARRLTQCALRRILDAGRWAPSGLNNQPWRFFLVRDPARRRSLCAYTHSRVAVRSAAVLCAVYLDTRAVYDRTKDLQSAGACIQNMLLAAASLGVGSCWIGDLLRAERGVNALFEVPRRFRLMAVIALGYPARSRMPKGRRKPLNEFIIKEG